MNDHVNKAENLSHPVDFCFHPNAFPSTWCPGCGIGTVIFALLDAVKLADMEFNHIRFICGIGCAGKAGDYFKLKHSWVKDGKLLQRIRQNLEKGDAEISLALMNNPDLLLSGGEDFNKGKTFKETGIIVFINNLIYSINNNHLFPMSPFCRKSTDGKLDLPFNVPALARQAGIRFTARWTPLQAGWLRYSLSRALKEKGISLIEVVSPCVVYDSEKKRILDAPEKMFFYIKHSCFFSGEKTRELDLRRDKIIIGEFIDK